MRGAAAIALALLLGGCATSRTCELTDRASENEAPPALASDGELRVTREYRSDDPEHGDWIVWRREGITWRYVRTLPSGELEH